MNSNPATTRRGLFGLFFRALIFGNLISRAAFGKAPEVGEIASRAVAGDHRFYIRRYRLQATVSLFSVPVLWRDGVGGACVSVEEVKYGEHQCTAIQFSGGSCPQRIRGFNRFGMTQEIVREEASVAVESAYFSFMTSSPEKDVDQAWRAFANQSRGMNLALARGTATTAECSTAIEHITSPADVTWMDCPRLIDVLRGRAKLPLEAVASRSGVVYPTFLFTVRKALADSQAHASYTFMHNAKLYDLGTSRTITNSQTVLTGRIFEKGTRSESDFRVYFDASDATGLPSRIEFRPRSFLRLVFEHDPQMLGPSLPALLVKEDA